MARSIFGFPLWIAMTIAMTLSALTGQSVAEENSKSARQSTPSNGNVTKSAAGEPVAIVAGQAIYQRDLDDLVESQMLSLRIQEYQIKSRALEDLIRQRLVEAEAKKQGATYADLRIGRYRNQFSGFRMSPERGGSRKSNRSRLP